MRWFPGTRIFTDASWFGLSGAELMACERAKVRARVVEPEPARSLPGGGALAGRDGGPEAELLEPRAQLFEAASHARSQHPQVGAADREHAAVEVLALALQ